MKTFDWNKHFETGLASVDAQHRRLVDLINGLGDALLRPGAEDDIGLNVIFDELTEYATQHFSEEEALSARAGVDARHRLLHHEHHMQFAQQLAVMWSSRGMVPDAAHTLHDFLCGWLAFHILGEDQDMARQIDLIARGSTPEAAYDACVSKAGDGSTGALLAAMKNLYRVLVEQNRALVSANASLEERVAERTMALQELNLRLESLSKTDGLLGIANRRHFDERLVLEWRRAARDRHPLSLLMIDIDHFKLYNDHYGHLAGDECLKAVCKVVQSRLKRSPDLLARYGGEELVVILSGTDEEGALVVARKILEALWELDLPHAASPVAGRVTVSIGVATLVPDPKMGSHILVDAADRALYMAKDAGRNRICVHSPK
jgi:hemerythrin